MIVIIDSQRNILVINPPLDDFGFPILPEGSGYQAVTISDTEATKFTTAGSSFSLALDDTVTVTPVAPAPSTTVAAGAGTGGGSAAFVTSALQPSSDLRGTIDVTIPVGAVPVADANGHYELAKVTFGQTRDAPIDLLPTQPGALSQALGNVFGDDFSTTGLSLFSTVAPVAGKTYRVGYALA